MQQFKRFCIIGGLGFIVDSLFFVFLSYISDNIMLARLLSFWVAASSTWLGNRIYTYSHQQFTRVIPQWCKHMFVAHLSGSINLLLFWFMKDITAIPIAFCLGILAGLFSNYFFSNRLVFIKTSN
ncbi:GtrA family protein [Colwellia demingiae]|uniref:GtrA family protein n=1 Tax=Colwellia demingiae TaxID=89401 RepID=A0A5C6QSN1_9GAMM|nr:GtrA family protein [Colwellia demingiae]TWX71662.1 GtrA family protein [Colwellia demingiae]